MVSNFLIIKYKLLLWKSKAMGNKTFVLIVKTTLKTLQLSRQLKLSNNCNNPTVVNDS